MGVRNINLHQISGNSINSFLSLRHQFCRPTIHARNLKLRKCIKLETAFNCRRYFFLDLSFLSHCNASARNFTIKSTRFFASVDIYLVF